jgi:hypothetical protein
LSESLSARTRLGWLLASVLVPALPAIPVQQDLIFLGASDHV